MEDRNQTTDIEQLNRYLRAELSAVDSYEECIDKIDDATVASQLRVLKTSHQCRAEVLADRVRTLGGTPAESPGVLDQVAKVVQVGAGLLGAQRAVSTLEDTEEKRLDLYHRGLRHLSLGEREFVQDELIPEQRRTNRFLRDIELNLNPS